MFVNEREKRMKEKERESPRTHSERENGKRKKCNEEFVDEMEEDVRQIETGRD